MVIQYLGTILTRYNNIAIPNYLYIQNMFTRPSKHLPSVSFRNPLFSQNNRSNKSEQAQRDHGQNQNSRQNNKQQNSHQNSFQILQDLQLSHVFQFIKLNHLQQFLMTLPSHDLKQAARKKAATQDLQFQKKRRLDRKNEINKTNILDLTVYQVFKRWHDTNSMSNRSQYDYQTQNRSNRIQDHPKYGMQLIVREPEKYYLGKKSHHYNHAKEIQRVYKEFGLLKEKAGEESENSQEGDEYDQHRNQNGQNSDNSSDELQDFILNDDAPIQYQQKIKPKRRKIILKKHQKANLMKKGKKKLKQKNQYQEYQEEQEKQEEQEEQEDQEEQEEALEEQSQNKLLKHYMAQQIVNENKKMNKKDEVQNSFKKANQIQDNPDNHRQTKRKMDIESD